MTREFELKEWERRQEEDKQKAWQELEEVIKLLEDKKAKDIVVIDVSKLTPITFYFVIATVDTDLQMDAIVGELDDKIGGRMQRGGGWTVIDKDDYMIHVFLPELRSYYELERIWNEGEFLVGERGISVEE